MENKPEKKLVVVLGSHRSGTSLLTAAVERIGACLGTKSEYVSDENPKGFFENEEIVNFNDRLLEFLGGRWDNPVFDGYQAIGLKDSSEILPWISEAEDIFLSHYGAHNFIVIKDPRMCQLLPFWNEAFNRCGFNESNTYYAHIVRHPIEVAQSQHKRRKLDPEFYSIGDNLIETVSLWFSLTYQSLRDIKSDHNIFFLYADLVNEPKNQIVRLAKFLDVEYSRKEVADFCSDFVDNNLRRNTADSEKTSKLNKEFPEAIEFYNQLELLALKSSFNHSDIQNILKIWQRPGSQRHLIESLIPFISRLATERYESNLNVKKEAESLGQAIVERDESRKLYQQVIVERDEFIGLYQHAISERDDRQRSYEELHKAHDQAVSERNVLQKQYSDILNSHSWRLTRGLRTIRSYLITKPGKLLSRSLFNMSQFIWVRLPVGSGKKSRLKKLLFMKLPFLFWRTDAYKKWKVLELHSVNTETDSSLQGLFIDEKDPYVPLCNDGVLINLPVRLIAFYLPQFHAIPENDKWWGEGFTEWTNVKPAQPQFEGHYQPHVPGELGYYDLTDPSVQKRQVELAKQFGVGGFCFYFYWFAGKRLLETPTLNYLNDASLDLPFCLCWANENWSRRWDGLEDDILMAQEHSAEDDLAFIEYVSSYLRDPRNIHINGRPLLLVYRPSLLPSPRETVKRWRDWCRENGIGEIYLTYTQSFETVDPTEYGFDAAVEFPPNNSGPPIITDKVEHLSPEFTGIVYDWRIFVERSKGYHQLDYTLFRSVTPSWDNTARRKSAGSIFANSSPAGYRSWLTRSIEDTLDHQENKDERLIFVNAWNEWAEGAYLEPDEKYGYAYLQATRDALEQTAKEVGKRRIVLVAHDAYPHGAQYLILNMAKVLHESMGFVVDIIVLGEGPLIEEYAKYANVYELAGVDPQGEIAESLVQNLFEQGAASAIANTTVTGLIVPVLKRQGFTVVSLIHELPRLIEDYELHDHVKVIARDADKIIFAAEAVKHGFESFVELDKDKVVIRPQGIYKKNSLQSAEQIKSARSELRLRFNLAEEAMIILGVGFADYRKGIDIFVESGIEVLKKNQNVYFLWLGDFEQQIEKKIKQIIEASGFNNHFIFPGLDYDSDVYYAAADIYALTSREDPFPSVLMEALDVKMPVVAFKDSGGAVELLSRGGGVLVDEMSSKAFSSTLNKLIDSPDKLRRLGQEGKQIIDEEFSFRKYLFDLTHFAETGLKRVSVVVPNYNYEQFVKDRLQSIINQSYPIYEIIVLDDASTDNSVSVIEEVIKDQHVDCKFIINANNSGNVFKQWAKGVELASGDYVWIAEADDLSAPEFLNEVMKGFNNSSTVMSYCESKQMDSAGNILCDNYLDYVSDICREKWLSNYRGKGINEITGSLAIKNTIPNASAVVFKRDTISKVFNEKINEIKQYKNAGDWLVYIYMLNNGDIAYSSKSLNNHRRHDSSVTISNFDIGQLAEIMAVQKMVRENFSLDSDTVRKANVYSETLYKQFRLETDAAPTIDRNEHLAIYIEGH